MLRSPCHGSGRCCAGCCTNPFSVSSIYIVSYSGQELSPNLSTQSAQHKSGLGPVGNAVMQTANNNGGRQMTEVTCYFFWSSNCLRVSNVTRKVSTNHLNTFAQMEQLHFVSSFVLGFFPFLSGSYFFERLDTGHFQSSTCYSLASIPEGGEGSSREHSSTGVIKVPLIALPHSSSQMR